jgi:hypothetical protein
VLGLATALGGWYVCDRGGGRSLQWRFEFETYLETLHTGFAFAEVIVGSNNRDAAGRRKGADAHAKGWADRMGLDTTVMDANWIAHGKGGGPRRNARMLAYLLAMAAHDKRLVVAFPGGTATADLCVQARAFGIPVLCYPELPPEPDVAA